MIWHKELFFPPHKHVLSVGTVFVMEIGRFLGLLADSSPGREPSPGSHIIFVTGSPVFVSCLEGVFRAYDLTLEASRKGRILRRQSWFTSAYVIADRATIYL